MDGADERTDDAVRESERELRLIVQSVAAMTCVFSPRGELIGGNQQLLDYFKYSSRTTGPR